MDIFKLGDKILALLEAVFGFWNNQISLVFAMLGQSPVSFKGGGPWAVIEGIEPVFVAVGSSLVVLFFVIGFCSESIDVKDEMRFESIFRMLIRLGLAEWFVANNVTIMKAFFTSIGNLVGLISAGTTTQLAIDSTQADIIKGIRVNAVAPGITETDMMKAVPKEVIEPMIERIPLRRLGQPEDIANAFVFLASDERRDIKVGKINVDEEPELANKFSIMSIPTLVVMKNGKIVQQVSGARPKNAILEML